MNLFKGLNHAVKFYSSAKGPLNTSKLKRDPGMSGRQWKKARKAARRKWKTQA